MSYLEMGYLIGFITSHVAAFAAGLWLRERYYREIRGRVAD